MPKPVSAVSSRSARRRMILSVCTAAALLLTSCAAPGSLSPEGGGSLVIGMVGSAGDTQNPYQFQGSTSSSALFRQMYEGLAYRGDDGAVELQLAESIEPNEARDVWTIKLHEGIKLHSGEELDAEDVVESLRWMIDPENGFAYANQLEWITSPEEIEIVDPLTVRLSLAEPFGLVREMLAAERMLIRSIRNGGTVEEPEGTGPFVLESFTPGREAKFTRFEDYWGTKPKVKSLTITYFTEQSAVTNAVRGGQIDIAQGVPFPEIPALEKDPNLEMLVSDTAAYPLIGMSSDHEPFDDPRIREAMRLAVDRPRIVSNAFGGYASVANDFVGRNTACAPPSVPQRAQDIEKARSLVNEAGAQGAAVELVTDAAFPGMVEMAQLIADDAEKIGLKISVRKVDVATFLDRWLEWPFYISFTSSPYEVTAKAHYLVDGSENGTAFNDATYTDLVGELNLAASVEEQCATIAKMQTIEYERGGYIIPVYGQQITVHRANVKGLRPNLYGRSAYIVGDVTVE